MFDLNHTGHPEGSHEDLQFEMSLTSREQLLINPRADLHLRTVSSQRTLARSELATIPEQQTRFTPQDERFTPQDDSSLVQPSGAACSRIIRSDNETSLVKLMDPEELCEYSRRLEERNRILEEKLLKAEDMLIEFNHALKEEVDRNAHLLHQLEETGTSAAEVPKEFRPMEAEFPVSKLNQDGVPEVQASRSTGGGVTPAERYLAWRDQRESLRHRQSGRLVSQKETRQPCGQLRHATESRVATQSLRRKVIERTAEL
eukprot:CAMPEP_0198199452 /NCGR_PEP_ID=MMETSP1445-20131203/2760_1 /TAXON_ID=36898 /ORGANISM="Pyramimonas sp., Strain CCMP2087" /LENGTH=258 /DNA_ID=CAMNT_0043869307 /DNA_START=333 /DNA_END=1106 /DNA_ORIENTATION=-